MKSRVSWQTLKLSRQVARIPNPGASPHVGLDPFFDIVQQGLAGLPGVGPIAAHVFSAIIEEPSRFPSKFKLWKYSQLGITDRTSDNKPLGYQRLDRRGNAELKNLSYHAWRTACKSTTAPNPIKTFYQQSRLRTGSVRHARLNTQRKILEAMWLIWLRRRRFDPNKFTQTQPAPQGASCGANQALEVRAIARQ